MTESDVAEARQLVELLRSDEGARRCWVATWGEEGAKELAELDAQAGTTTHAADGCSCIDPATCRCLRAMTGSPDASLDDLLACYSQPVRRVEHTPGARPAVPPERGAAAETGAQLAHGSG